MKCVGDLESVNLSTGERRQRVAGEGESTLRVWRGPIDEVKFGPQDFDPDPTGEKMAELILAINCKLKGNVMHYRNGRLANNGDKIVKLDDKGNIISFGVLHSATPGNDYCNGNIAAIQPQNDYACMVDCLHIEDIAELLKAKELDKRPSGK